MESTRCGPTGPRCWTPSRTSRPKCSGRRPTVTSSLWRSTGLEPRRTARRLTSVASPSWAPVRAASRGGVFTSPKLNATVPASMPWCDAWRVPKTARAGDLQRRPSPSPVGALSAAASTRLERARSQIASSASPPTRIAAARRLLRTGVAHYYQEAHSRARRPVVASRRRSTSVRGIASAAVASVLLLLVLWGGTHALRTWWGIVLLGTLLATGVAALRHETLREFPGWEADASPAEVAAA